MLTRKSTGIGVLVHSCRLVSARGKYDGGDKRGGGNAYQTKISLMHDAMDIIYNETVGDMLVGKQKRSYF